VSKGPLTSKQLDDLLTRRFEAGRNIIASDEDMLQAAARLGMELAAKICMDLDLKRGKATHDYLDCVAAIRERARK
jgi:hypothetical protein